MDSFIGWIGGKKQLRDEIITRFPIDGVGRYIEVFGGAAWVLFRKEKHAPLEVYNDADGGLVNLFRCAKHHARELQRELQWHLNSREVFMENRAQEHVPGLTDIQRAARFLATLKSSYGCDRHSFGCSKTSLPTSIERLPEIQKRLERVVIEHKDFQDLIKVYDRPDAFFYCDPPYLGTEQYYNGSFTWADHERLRDTLMSIQGRFLLSYNEDPRVRELYAGCAIESVSRGHNLAMRYKAGAYEEVIIRNY